MSDLFVLEYGRKRPAALVVCGHCCNQFLAQVRFIAKGEGKFCSKSCAWAANKNRTEVPCAVCGIYKSVSPSKLRLSKSGMYFCNRKCKEVAQRLDGGMPEIWPGHYGTAETSENNYRAIAFRNLPHCCNRCGYQKVIGVLQVHHIDRDKTNSNILNLEILCPTCHMEEHYREKDGLWKQTKTKRVVTTGP